jgi:phosphatidylcholine synthase
MTPSLSARTLAWAVHAYTASGAVWGLLALLAILEGDYRQGFFWLALQVFIDATDGVLARAARVSEITPSFNGTKLDDLVDYLTYVFVPAVFFVHAPVLPDGVDVAIAAAMLVASGYGFSRDDAKTSDHFFTGFPSYWNVVAVYLLAWQLGPWVNANILAALVVLVFVPVRYIYPSRTTTLMGLSIALGAAWAVLMLWMIWRLPDVPTWMRWATLVYPVYYFVLSLVLSRRREG